MRSSGRLQGWRTPGPSLMCLLDVSLLITGNTGSQNCHTFLPLVYQLCFILFSVFFQGETFLLQLLKWQTIHRFYLTPTRQKDTEGSGSGSPKPETTTSTSSPPGATHSPGWQVTRGLETMIVILLIWISCPSLPIGVGILLSTPPHVPSDI